MTLSFSFPISLLPLLVINHHRPIWEYKKGQEEARTLVLKLSHTVMCQLLGRVPLCVTPWSAARRAPLSMGFSRQEHCSGLPFLLQGIFLTQGLNPGPPHCRQILYQRSHQGSPVSWGEDSIFASVLCWLEGICKCCWRLRGFSSPNGITLRPPSLGYNEETSQRGSWIWSLWLPPRVRLPLSGSGQEKWGAELLLSFRVREA